MKKLVVLFLLLVNFTFLLAAKYYCPMKCEGEKTYENAGDCPVCHMHLEKKPDASKGPINSLDFRAEVKATPEKIEAKKEVEFKIRILNTKNNTALVDFDTVHEKQMHLVVVSQDLTYFAHLHPEKKDDMFVIKTEFPYGGNYILYADVTPKGTDQQIFPLAVKVEGSPAPTAPPISSKAMSTVRKVGDYQGRLQLDSPPVSGMPMTLKFTAKLKNDDIKSFEPYLGAPAHMILIHEDTTQFLHAHPMDHDHGGGDQQPINRAKKLGKVVRFMTTFPKPGTYKVWVEFQHKGQVVTTDYVVRIKS